MRQVPLPLGPEAEPTFESFLPGANAAALDHLRRADAAAGPVYLWGPEGSGKTHLLQAALHAIRARGARGAIFGPESPLPWPVDEGLSLAAIDDCQALDAAAQHAAFTLFVEAAAHGVRVLAAGRLPPVDLPLREDLRTRLGWGAVFALHPLDEPQVRATLRREADRRGIWLSDEVMDYVLVRFARDLKQLMGLLDRLDRFALAERRLVTVPLLRQMLDEEHAP